MQTMRRKKMIDENDIAIQREMQAILFSLAEIKPYLKIKLSLIYGLIMESFQLKDSENHARQ